MKIYKLILQVKNICAKGFLYKLYCAFVFPHINYGAEVYANCAKSTIDKLNTLNNKILRILLNKKYDTPNIELYRILNVLPVSLLHEMKLLELIHKCHYHKRLLPVIFQQYFITNDSIYQHHTRNIQNLHIPTVNSNAGQRRCLYRGSKLWNALPDHFKTYSSIAAFKTNVKHYLLWR